VPPDGYATGDGGISTTCLAIALLEAAWAHLKTQSDSDLRSEITFRADTHGKAILG
jgi:hypothetical protein